MPPYICFGGKADQSDKNADGREGRTDSVHHGQHSVAIGHDEEGDEAYGIKDQEQLPRGGRPVRMIKRHRRGYQGGEPEVHGQGDGPIPNKPCPTRDEGQYCAISRPSELERPVVRTCRCGIARGKLAQGEGHTLVNDEDDDPAEKHRQLACGHC